mmetsp:Transcript_16171/g.37888  ORF Transcript_16171/g.37888 Transcript_16171/m.37888 type:complete len:108 (-) Transcript_16171:13-336(-)
MRNWRMWQIGWQVRCLDLGKTGVGSGGASLAAWRISRVPVPSLSWAVLFPVAELSEIRVGGLLGRRGRAAIASAAVASVAEAGVGNFGTLWTSERLLEASDSGITVS